MASDPRTRAYVARQREAGFSSREILRKLKRGIAREVFRNLTSPVTVPEVDDLRPLRRSKNITLTTAANHLGVWPATISEIERGIRRDDTLTQTYRNSDCVGGCRSARLPF
jgi:transposase